MDESPLTRKVLTAEEREGFRNEYALLQMRFKEAADPAVKESIQARMAYLHQIAAQGFVNAVPEIMEEPSPVPEQPYLQAGANERAAALIEEYSVVQSRLAEPNLEKIAQTALAEKSSDIVRQLADLGYTPEGHPTAEGPKRKAPSEPIALPPPEVQRQAEELIKQFRVQKMRGQSAQATETLRQALAIAPTSPQVQEALGDEYKEVGETKNAREAYLLAHRADPKDANIERKYAETILRLGSADAIQRALESGNLDSLLLSKGDSYARPGAAAFLSALVPGTGQLVQGKNELGIGLLVSWIILLLITFTLRSKAVSGIFRGGIHFEFLTILLLILIFGVQIYSIAECLPRNKDKEVPFPDKDFKF